MPITRKRWRQLGTLGFLVLFGWLLLFWRGDRGVAALVEAVRAAGWLPFFAAMTLFPLAGFPVTPFYLLGGAVFGEWWCLLGTGVSLLVNLLLAYALSVSWLRDALQSLLARRGGRDKLPRFEGRNAWLYVLAIRVTPGPPLSVKSYLAGLAGVPLRPFLLVSWPIAMGYAAGLIVLGDSMTEQRWFGVLAGVLLIAVFLGLMWTVRKRLPKLLRGVRRR